MDTFIGTCINTPQLTQLMEAIEKWLLEGEEKGKTN